MTRPGPVAEIEAGLRVHAARLGELGAAAQQTARPAREYAQHLAEGAVLQHAGEHSRHTRTHRKVVGDAARLDTVGAHEDGVHLAEERSDVVRLVDDIEWER